MNTTTTKTIIGIDLGDKQHAICVTDRKGNILKEFSIRNRIEELKNLADQYPNSVVAMEVGTHSPWISRLFAEHGLQVFVANARKLRAIYTNPRKSDELDAQMLAKIAGFDPELLSPITHSSLCSQQDMLAIKMRDTLVRQRRSLICSIRFSLKAMGVILPLWSSSVFSKRALLRLEDQPEVLGSLKPLLHILNELTTQIKQFDKSISEIAETKYPQATWIQQIHGVGPITSLCFVLHIEDPNRFAAKKRRDVGAYLGLVPRRDQSGQTDKQLPISKAGNSYLRTLLVQSAQYILGHCGPDCDLRRHGLKLAARGGKAAKKRAIIAVARKLSVIMLSLWQNQSEYQPLRNSLTTAI
ncbi:MAG: IS110 family transposase [Planctomycetia bacterium]|nr:IS110 family transposase [Planctomycetia bacterium]